MAVSIAVATARRLTAVFKIGAGLVECVVEEEGRYMHSTCSRPRSLYNLVTAFQGPECYLDTANFIRC